MIQSRRERKTERGSEGERERERGMRERERERERGVNNTLVSIKT